MPGFIEDGKNFIFSFTNGDKLQIKSGSTFKKNESESLHQKIEVDGLDLYKTNHHKEEFKEMPYSKNLVIRFELQ